MLINSLTTMLLIVNSAGFALHSYFSEQQATICFLVYFNNGKRN